LCLSILIQKELETLEGIIRSHEDVGPAGALAHRADVVNKSIPAGAPTIPMAECAFFGHLGDQDGAQSIAYFAAIVDLTIAAAAAAIID